MYGFDPLKARLLRQAAYAAAEAAGLGPVERVKVAGHAASAAIKALGLPAIEQAPGAGRREPLWATEGGLGRGWLINWKDFGE